MEAWYGLVQERIRSSGFGVYGPGLCCCVGVQAREPSRSTASDTVRQEALRRRIFGMARVAGPGHIDFDTLAEMVLAITSDQPEPCPRVVAP